MNELVLRNHQRLCRVHTPLLRCIVRSLLTELRVKDYELGVHLVAAPEITRLNESFLHYAGPTDVISFDHTIHDSHLHGEIFICVDEALAQSRRFRTTWQCELVRYLVHGVLHLVGHDDQRPSARRKMKREEYRVLRLLSSRFPLSQLARKPKLRP